MRGHELPGPNQRKSKSSPTKSFLQNLVKGKGKLGFLNPMGALASKVGGPMEKILNPMSMLTGGGDEGDSVERSINPLARERQ